MPVTTRTCDDCGTSNMEMYMIRHKLWLSVAANRDILCLPCFEARLGRKVTLHDLLPCTVTHTMFLGAYVAGNTPDLPPVEVLLHASSYVNDERTFNYERGNL